MRLWIDGSQVGLGTPATGPIVYSGSGGIYIGTYRGSCDLGFSGAIDDATVWDDRPAEATTGPVIDPVADAPTHIAIGSGNSSTGPGATSSQPKGCLRVSLNRHTIPVRHTTKLVATVRRGSRRMAGVRLVVKRDRGHHQGPPHHRPQGQDQDRRARGQGRGASRSPSAARRPAARPPPSAPARSAWQDARMRISARADYAVRAAVVLAAAGDGPTKGEAIAQAQSIPLKFLENILGDLRHAGLVRSQRGADGGYWLGRPAGDITVADVIRAVEGPLASVRGGPPEEVDYQGAAEPLQQVWIAVRASLRSVVERVTLADVAAGRLPARVAKLAEDPEAWVTR